MNLLEAAEMALKFCDDIGDLDGPYPYVNKTGIVSDSRKVLEALRQALAHPEQKPVVWMCRGIYSVTGYCPKPKREWVGLTDADIAQTMHGSVEGSNMLPYQFARAIETKLKEKNT